MLRKSVAVLALLLVGCSQTQPAAGVSPSQSQASSTPTLAPTASPTSSTSPNALAGLPVTRVDFSCRLPVVTGTGGGDGITYQGGFINFPGGALTQDPAGVIQSRYFEQDLATAATPVLHGTGGYPFYDRAQSRWVPASASESLPDGSGYAYAATAYQTNVQKIYVVSVASGNARAFTLPSPERAGVADYGLNGVYLFSGSALGGPGEGVWLLSPGTGVVTQSWVIHSVWTVRDGYAWVARLDPRDNTVWPPAELAPANSLVRIDLATGAEMVWFYRAGTYPWLLGLDSMDRPIVTYFENGTNQMRLIDRPGSPGQLIYAGNTGMFESIQADGSRLWFGSKDGIYLYTPNRGLQKVYAFAGDPMTYSGIQPAGFCI